MERKSYIHIITLLSFLFFVKCNEDSNPETNPNTIQKTNIGIGGIKDTSELTKSKIAALTQQQAKEILQIKDIEKYIKDKDIVDELRKKASFINAKIEYSLKALFYKAVAKGETEEKEETPISKISFNNDKTKFIIEYSLECTRNGNKLDVIKNNISQNIGGNKDSQSIKISDGKIIVSKVNDNDNKVKNLTIGIINEKNTNRLRIELKLDNTKGPGTVKYNIKFIPNNKTVSEGFENDFEFETKKKAIKKIYSEEIKYITEWSFENNKWIPKHSEFPKNSTLNLTNLVKRASFVFNIKTGDNVLNKFKVDEKSADKCENGKVILEAKLKDGDSIESLRFELMENDADQKDVYLTFTPTKAGESTIEVTFTNKATGKIFATETLTVNVSSEKIYSISNPYAEAVGGKNTTVKLENNKYTIKKDNIKFSVSYDLKYIEGEKEQNGVTKTELVNMGKITSRTIDLPEGTIKVYCDRYEEEIVENLIISTIKESSKLKIEFFLNKDARPGLVECTIEFVPKDAAKSKGFREHLKFETKRSLNNFIVEGVKIYELEEIKHHTLNPKGGVSVSQDYEYIFRLYKNANFSESYNTEVLLKCRKQKVVFGFNLKDDAEVLYNFIKSKKGQQNKCENGDILILAEIMEGEGNIEDLRLSISGDNLENVGIESILKKVGETKIKVIFKDMFTGNILEEKILTINFEDNIKEYNVLTDANIEVKGDVSKYVSVSQHRIEDIFQIDENNSECIIKHNLKYTQRGNIHNGIIKSKDTSNINNKIITLLCEDGELKITPSKYSSLKDFKISLEEKGEMKDKSMFKVILDQKALENAIKYELNFIPNDISKIKGDKRKVSIYLEYFGKFYLTKGFLQKALNTNDELNAQNSCILDYSDKIYANLSKKEKATFVCNVFKKNRLGQSTTIDNLNSTSYTCLKNDDVKLDLILNSGSDIIQNIRFGDIQNKEEKSGYSSDEGYIKDIKVNFDPIKAGIATINLITTNRHLPEQSEKKTLTIEVIEDDIKEYFITNKIIKGGGKKLRKLKKGPEKYKIGNNKKITVEYDLKYWQNGVKKNSLEEDLEVEGQSLAYSEGTITIQRRDNDGDIITKIDMSLVKKESKLKLEFYLKDNIDSGEIQYTIKFNPKSDKIKGFEKILNLYLIK